MSNVNSLTDYERVLIANVGAYGCHVVSVFDPADDTKNFSYSVGFWETVGQPEVIILGLDSTMGAYAINETLRQCRAGLRLFDGQIINDLFEEFSVTCVARRVAEHHLTPIYFNSAIWYHHLRTDGPLASALQLVWTYDGYLPWEVNAPADLIEDQPALYEGVLN